MSEQGVATAVIPDKDKRQCANGDLRENKVQTNNCYDYSVTYVDHFISSVIDQVRDKKAIVFYAADHGES
ncbi:sulfatase-like hydrolase/transferase, partial [Enterobacter hormaechei subsp. steigerwaltii]|nr:sulfatase-like hydrolase/transferase [Enterobacter hormaechei subsp. steigerwaltii]